MWFVLDGWEASRRGSYHLSQIAIHCVLDRLGQGGAVFAHPYVQHKRDRARTLGNRKALMRTKDRVPVAQGSTRFHHGRFSKETTVKNIARKTELSSDKVGANVRQPSRQGFLRSKKCRFTNVLKAPAGVPASDPARIGQWSHRGPCSVHTP